VIATNTREGDAEKEVKIREMLIFWAVTVNRFLRAAAYMTVRLEIGFAGILESRKVLVLANPKADGDFLALRD
jgi:hypothetical protein